MFSFEILKLSSIIFISGLIRKMILIQKIFQVVFDNEYFSLTSMTRFQKKKKGNKNILILCIYLNFYENK